MKKPLLIACSVTGAVGRRQLAGAQSFEDAVARYTDANYKAAYGIARPLADNGDARAMAMLGTMYQNGLGVEKNIKEAVTWLTAAAEKDFTGAQFSLALIYLDGLSGKPDLRGGHDVDGARRQGRASAGPAQHGFAGSRRQPARARLDRARRNGSQRRPSRGSPTHSTISP